MSEYDRSMIFMPLAEAQRYFSKPGQVDVLELVVSDPEKIDDQIKAMKATVPAAPSLRRLARAQRDLLHRPRSRAQR